MRKICYISGTRADYGLMRTVLMKINADPSFKLSLCVTAMHLSPTYGNTINEILADHLNVIAQIPVDVETSSPASMAKAIGDEIIGFVEVLSREQPHLILLLGDRGEMLAAAIAASHLNIPIVHIHGGERSGTVDEMVRHAISKFAHYHFVATEASRERLIKMGEQPSHIYHVGAPGLDEIVAHTPSSRASFCQSFQLRANEDIALVIFHPIVQAYNDLKAQITMVLKAALDLGLQLICFEPNADAGAHTIRDVLIDYRAHPEVRLFKHMPRTQYLDCLANVDLMLGNSSSGIIEAASFNLGVVNVGLRQNLRERGNNVFDTDVTHESITTGLKSMLARKGETYHNIYGDGQTGVRCCDLLKTISLHSDILNKYNAY